MCAEENVFVSWMTIITFQRVSKKCIFASIWSLDPSRIRKILLIVPSFIKTKNIFSDFIQKYPTFSQNIRFYLTAVKTYTYTINRFIEQEKTQKYPQKTALEPKKLIRTKRHFWSSPRAKTPITNSNII